ncbi:MAG TPA: prepilin-type N-terminal cleavage/methylation domain-containing protein [Pyrinomonadaceae bacterium]|nr:prepilin-type N-terminal cleavage/methylation domain-containing protein [Pyrinomonadaceae bacterium]
MNCTYRQNPVRRTAASQGGFTLLEAAIALVILMVIGLGIASLFTYSISANSKADDRELAMAIAQKRMEWLRTIPFTTQTRGVAYSYPNGGLAATATAGVSETVTNAGRSYTVNTTISDLNFVPVGQPDAGACTLKRIQVSVTPATATTNFEIVTVYTLRSTQVTGSY